jgi:hypothetical protein
MGGQAGGEAGGQTGGQASGQAAAQSSEPKRDTKRGAKRDTKQGAKPDSGERGLRDLIGAGSSQLGVSGALRARDVNRPTEEDLAAAERDTVIVRRNWKPPD